MPPAPRPETATPVAQVNPATPQRVGPKPEPPKANDAKAKDAKAKDDKGKDDKGNGKDKHTNEEQRKDR
jgi:hypothetical protein